MIPRGADAVPLLRPSLGRRIAALVHGTRARLADRRRLIALSFDDGPYPVTTPLLLQTLRDLDVPATFFLIGRDAQQFPALTRAIAAAGGEIANHTLTHPDLDRLPPLAVVAELRAGADALRALAPDPAETRLFRPPHGRYRLATVQAAQSAGYDTILWTDDPGDWRSVSAAEIVRHVEERATAPEILLLHSGRRETIVALPALVARFRAAGYRFVTVGTLLHGVPASHLNGPAKLTLVAGASSSLSGP